MASLNGFNPDEVPEGEFDGFEPIPPGRYELEVVDSDLVKTRAGDGEILKLQHRVVSGPFENRRIFTQHNYRNPSAKAQEIGQRELKNLCAAIGHTGPLEDSNDLHGIPFMASVKIERDSSGQYEPKNAIGRFIPRDGGTNSQHAAPAQRSAPAQQQRQAAPPENSGGNRPGWMNRAGAAR